MQVICSWCKKHVATKEPVEDTRISHTICRDCSIKYFDKDPGERDTSDDVPNPIPSRSLKTKRGIRTVWNDLSSNSKYRLVVDANAFMPRSYYDMHKYMNADWTALPKDLQARVKRLFYGARPARKERMPKNPAKSARQRKFMCAELGRKRAGKKTRTGMSERSLRDFCSKRKNPQVPMWKSRLIFQAEELAKSGAGYTQYEIIDYLKNQNKDISEKSIESAVKIALKAKKRKRKNPTVSASSVWKRVVKEMAVYLRKAGYDKDTAYVSIRNRLSGVPDAVVRSSVTEAYRVGKNRRKARR